MLVEFLASGREPVVVLQLSNNHGVLGFGHKARSIKKILDGDALWEVHSFFRV